MIAIVDYGMGNVYSVASALRYLGAKPILTADPELVAAAEHLILPGVGSFRNAMTAMRERGLDAAIHEAVESRGAKILGICLGMQLLGSSGSEGGDTAGLGLIPNSTNEFLKTESGLTLKIPHVGFDTVNINSSSGIFQNLPSEADFYFTHSYRMLVEGLNGKIGTCSYGVDFLAAFDAGSVCGAQFHPEKSQTNGLVMFNNFLQK